MSCAPRALAALLAASLATAGCEPPRDASSLSVQSYIQRTRTSSSIRFVTTDAKMNEVPEDELARLYEARTHKTDLRYLDHGRRGAAAPLLVAGAILLVAPIVLGVFAASRCTATGEAHGGCASLVDATVGATIPPAILLLGVGAAVASTSDPHDRKLTRPQTEQVVDEYNRARAARVQPVLGPGGVGVAF